MFHVSIGLCILWVLLPGLTGPRILRTIFEQLIFAFKLSHI